MQVNDKINPQVGRVGVINMLQRINKASRTLSKNENNILTVKYKTSPVELQKRFEQVNNLVTESMLNVEAAIQLNNDDVDEMATKLLIYKDDIDYQEMILSFIDMYPQYRELFE